MNSSISLKVYSLIKSGVIKSNADFWKNFYNEEKVNSFEIDTQNAQEELGKDNIKIISVFDNDFPNAKIKLKNSEKPFFFVYRGDISLLNDTSKNIAVIGVINPTNDIIEREQKVVQTLLNKDCNIVSGLAKGCDTVAHNECVKENKKTIAFLPTTINNIYPKENIKLADEIVENGGLIITEYVSEPKNKYESVKRFIERDRLQALYSKAVILIASYRKDEGDSGSRHAFEKAKEYDKERLVMFNEKTDKDKAIFGLNQDYVASGEKVLTLKEIEDL